MKKSIILLSTLFFISTILVFILDNMKDTNNLLKESNIDFINTQAIISINNYKDEIGKLLIKHKNIVEKQLPLSIPLNIENISVLVNLKSYDRIYDINTIINKKGNQDIKEFFSLNNIDYDSFEYFLRNYMNSMYKVTKVTNFKQINKIIKAYTKSVDNNEIQNIQDSLGFTKYTEKSNLILCNLDIKISNKTFISEFVYDLNTIKESDIKVKDFELTFK